MPLTRMIARPMLASMFVYGGLDSIRNPEGKADAAEPVSEMLGHPMENTDLVRLNGAIQVGAGTMLALGKFPRLSAAALAASLVPTTYAGHRFWEADDEHRKAQTIQFFKNLSMLGGLVLAALDTEGRPSVAWRTKHAMAAAPATLAMQAERRSARARRKARKASRKATKGALVAGMAGGGRLAAEAARKAAVAGREGAELGAKGVAIGARGVAKGAELAPKAAALGSKGVAELAPKAAALGSKGAALGVKGAALGAKGAHQLAELSDRIPTDRIAEAVADLRAAV